MTRKEAHRALYESAFPDSEAYVSWFFANKYDPAKAVDWEEGGRVISALHLVERTISMTGVSFRCPFIVAAATLPEYRHQGYFQKVMVRVLRRLYDEGYLLTELFPVNHRYYLQYGFADAGLLRTVEVPALALKRLDEAARARSEREGEGLAAAQAPVGFRPERPVGGRRSWRRFPVDQIGPIGIRAIERADWPAMAAMYENYVRGRDGYVVRTEADFARRVEEIRVDGGEGQLLFGVLDGKELPLGYFFREADGTVPEIVAERMPVPLLLPFFGGCRVELPADLTLGKSAEGNQLRVVNARNLLEQLRYAEDGEACFRLHDPVLPENEGALRLAVREGRGTVTSCADAEYDLEIGDLARLAAGSCAVGADAETVSAADGHLLPAGETGRVLARLFGRRRYFCAEKY